MTAANPSHALALVLVDELARCGITEAVLAPGSRSTSLAMALHAEPRIRLHVVVDERSAAFLAVGLARVSGRPVPVVTTSGSATANLHPAVIEADAADVPLLLLTADRPPRLRATGANQAIDQLGLYGRAVRWWCEVGAPEDRHDAPDHWRSVACRAVAATTGLHGAPGPVHLNLAFHEPTVPVTDDGRTAAAGPWTHGLGGRPDGRPWTDVVVSPPRAPDVDVARLTDLVRSTARGLVVVGDLPPTWAAAEVAAGITGLARAAGWPVLADPVGWLPGLDVTAHGGPVLGAAVADLQPELVVRVGRVNASRGIVDLLGADARQVQVGTPGRWDDPHRTAADLIVADPGDLLTRVADGLSGHTPDGGWTDTWTAASVAAAVVAAELDADEYTLDEPSVARATAAAVPTGGQLAVASSMPVRDVADWAQPRSDIRVVANRGASGIDGFVSTALGAALAHDGPTVALAGDLSFLHDRNGLLVADRPDLVLVVVDNDGGGIFHFLPQAQYTDSFEAVFGTPHGLDLAAVGRTHGMAVHQPGTVGDLAAAIRVGLDSGGWHLVHVRTDRHANVEVHQHLRTRVADAVRAGR